MKMLLGAVLSLGACSSHAGAQPLPEKSALLEAVIQDRLEKDLALLIKWSQGTFDNEELVAEQERLNLPKSHRYRRDSYRFTRIDNVPQLGGVVTLAQSFKQGDESQPEFVTVISYEPSIADNAIIFRVNYVRGHENYFDAHKNHDLIRALKPGVDTSVNNEACVTLVRRLGDQFVTQHKGGSCSYEIEGRPTVTNHLIAANGKDERWIWSLGVYDDGGVRYGNLDKVFNVYKRIK